MGGASSHLVLCWCASLRRSQPTPDAHLMRARCCSHARSHARRLQTARRHRHLSLKRPHPAPEHATWSILRLHGGLCATLARMSYSVSLRRPNPPGGARRDAPPCRHLAPQRRLLPLPNLSKFIFPCDAPRPGTSNRPARSTIIIHTYIRGASFFAAVTALPRRSAVGGLSTHNTHIHIHIFRGQGRRGPPPSPRRAALYVCMAQASARS